MEERLSKVAKEYNVGVSTLIKFLKEKGYKNIKPNSKIGDDAIKLISKKFESSKKLKEEAAKKFEEIKSTKLKNVGLKEKNSQQDIQKTEDFVDKEETILVKDPNALVEESKEETIHKETQEIQEKAQEEAHEKEETQEDLSADKKDKKITGPKILGKIDLEKSKKKKRKKAEEEKSDIKKTTKTKPTDKIKEKTPKKQQEPTKEEQKVQNNKEIINEKEAKEIKEEIQQNNIKEDTTTIETKQTSEESVKTEEKETVSQQEDNYIKIEKPVIEGPTVVGKIELKEKPKKSVKKVVSSDEIDLKKKKKKKFKGPQKKKETTDTNKEIKDKFSKRKKHKDKKRKNVIHKEVNQEEVDKQVKETISKLTTKQKKKSVKYRREKRQAKREQLEQELQEQLDNKKIKVTEFITVSELASIMEVSPTEVIKVCMELDMLVSINQRLDADVIPLIAENFGYEVEFKTIEDEIKEFEEIEEDKEEDLKPRPPVVTIMGHVDHGKTKLLDYIRNTNVVAGEAGGITQHIGAYSVDLNGNKITFIDTPGHEAFTAMRARGAQVTDIAIIVIAADDGIMPQTVEAINHAQVAGVEMIFAINKIDKPTANPDRIYEQLANLNILVEKWGGKYVSQEISAKTGKGVDELLEKILTLAELMELKANPNTLASGTVIESSLEKGKGYVATLLVQRGTLRVRDLVVSGIHYGRVKVIQNERGQKIKEAGPSMPVQILGLDGAPDAGDKFKVIDNEDLAKDITNKRKQLLREQTIKTQKHITLEEIGRRLQMGNFLELNFIIKADVIGSVEALADSILKLSTSDLKINVIHKAVGQITESDVMLASASNAIIVGFNVRPSAGARKLAEQEQVDIRLYSIIYDAIEDLKKAMEGMLSPEIKEEILGSAEVLEVFKISKVGKIAGCKVVEGKIKKDAKVRVIRDGIVIYDGEILSLKHFQNDVDVVHNGQECGIGIKNFNDVKKGDTIEAYKTLEIQRKL